jgi:hypothetical protein
MVAGEGNDGIAGWSSSPCPLLAPIIGERFKCAPFIARIAEAIPSRPLPCPAPSLAIPRQSISFGFPPFLFLNLSASRGDKIVASLPPSLAPAFPGCSSSFFSSASVVAAASCRFQFLPAIPVEVACYVHIHARRCLRVQQSGGNVVRQVGRQEGPAQAALRRRRPPARRRVGAFRLSLCF